MLRLYYPVRPFHVNQAFGANPDYYAKFLDAFGNPEKGHMGVDLMAAHGQPVYAAHDGMARYVGPDSHGGDGVYIRTTDTYDSNTGTSWYTSIYWHLIAMTDPQLHPQVPANGNEVAVKAGELIGYADNTGAPFESSGDHLHFGLFPCDSNGNPVFPANGYGGCIDPTPFFTGIYADSVAALIDKYTSLVSILKALVGALSVKKQ